MEIRKVSLEKENSEKELIQSLKETGFAIITDVNIPNLDKVYNNWKDFFKLSNKEKNKYKYDPSTDKQEGYFPFKSENAKDQAVPDLKEFYHYFDQEQLLPESINKDEMILFHQTVMDLQRKVLDCISKDLGVDLIQAAQQGHGLTRIIYYPEIKEKSDSVRAAAHEDINLITVLPASTNPGLEAQDNEGNWHEVGTNHGDVIINVGDMVQMLSKGVYKSTTHRVKNLPGDRLSIPTFIHPNPEFDLGEMTAGEYLRQRLEEIGLKG